MLMGSEHHRHVCAECAEICEACVADCESLGGMKECVEACRRCAAPAARWRLKEPTPLEGSFSRSYSRCPKITSDCTMTFWTNGSSYGRNDRPVEFDETSREPAFTVFSHPTKEGPSL